MRYLVLLFIISPFFSQAGPTNKWPKIDEPQINIHKQAFKWVTGKNGALVLFISEHCPFDKDWQTRIVKQAQWAKKNDFFVVVINPFKSKKFIKNKVANQLNTAKFFGKDIPYVRDLKQKLARQFGATRSPSAYVFNADKKRVYYGAIDNQPEKEKTGFIPYLKNALEATKTGKKVSPSYINPLGCKIF